MSDHLLYVDESGQKELAADYSLPRAPSRYFVFGGLLLSQRGASIIDEQMRQLKRSAFGTDVVEVKSNWLRIPHERERHFLKRFGLSDDQLDDFVRALEDMISGVEGCLLAAVVDKKRQAERYPGRVHYAPATAYDVLLQRAQLAMEAADSVVHVVLDDMDGATPNLNQYKDNLCRQHRQLRTAGSGIRPMSMDRIGSLRFTDSATDNRVQAADLVAYNVFRHFREFGEAWDGTSKPAPIYERLDRMWSAFRCSPSGCVPGYGIALLPKPMR